MLKIGAYYVMFKQAFTPQGLAASEMAEYAECLPITNKDCDSLSQQISVQEKDISHSPTDSFLADEAENCDAEGGWQPSDISE
jgi:hypothetical protein